MQRKKALIIIFTFAFILVKCPTADCESLRSANRQIRKLYFCPSADDAEIIDNDCQNNISEDINALKSATIQVRRSQVQSPPSGNADTLSGTNYQNSAPVQLKAPKSANIQVGRLQINPSLGIAGIYSDNVYHNYDARDKESDFITAISPGIGFILPLRRHNIQLGYKSDIYRFADFSENDYFNQKVAGSLNFDFPGGLLFSVSDAFGDITLPRRWKKQPGVSGMADEYREMDHQNNDFNIKAKYSFVDRWAVEARYNNHHDNYKEEYDKLHDFIRNMYGGAFYYRFTPKTNIFLEYSFSDIDYDYGDINDNYNHMAYIGLSFDPTAKIRGYAGFGWDMKIYKNWDASRDDDSLSIFSTKVDLSYIATDFDQIKLSAIRVIEEDIDTLKAYTDTNLTLDWKHVFGWNEKISMITFMGYGNYDYNYADTDVDGTIKTRQDDFWKAGIGFDYALQPWLNLSLNYGYRRHYSNYKRYDYSENRVLSSVNVKY
ncbi:MAG: outer membrane beta-barrel protein [Syntrophaceae bacterium]|nr:outer membrane beta-barrel protein [Syntrophaceae bacterium]